MIHIIGLGGVGFWLTIGLSRMVPASELHCWDDDTIEGTGATRLPLAPSRTTKTDLLYGFLAMTFGDVVLPTMHPTKFTAMTGVTANDLVIDCTDMPLVRRKRMWTYSRKAGAKLLRVSYDGRGSTVLVSTGLPLMAPPGGGYAAMPSLALSFAAGGIGAEAVKRYIDKPVDSFTVALSIEESMK